MRKQRSIVGGARARWPWARRGALAAAAAALATAGCGNLPLVDTLFQESPGELRFSPTTAAVPLATACTLSVLGGITPYSLVSGAANPLDESTWEFQAQGSISGDWQDFPIQVSDWAGKTATVVVRVYAGGPALSLTELTLPEGIGWTFTVSGGAPPYSWNLDGVYKAAGGSYGFLPAPQGSYILDVVDSLGASQMALVTVVPNPIGVDALSLTPVSAVVLPGTQVAFTALGGDGAYAFSAPDGGALGGTNPVLYTAPGTVGTYRILLADGSGGAPVEGEVLVTATGTLLVLFPASQSVSAIDQEVQFSASGGSPPYTFSSNRPAFGSIDPVTGLYRQLAGGNVVVTVQDSAGLTDNTLVKWLP